jgi:predicted dinucleotide-binding enzyme
MKIGILGTGIVGTTLGNWFISKGHQVMLGSRSAQNENGTKWLEAQNDAGSLGTFNDAAPFGDIVFNCTSGIYSLEALRTVSKESLANKILIDLANPADFSGGMPPRLTICNDNSLGEEIQKLFPATKVVKALNTVSYQVMTNPQKLNSGKIDLFICGNDTEAKNTAGEFLVREMNWHRENIIDLGEITHARSTEALLLFISSMAMRFGAFEVGIKTHLH